MLKERTQKHRRRLSSRVRGLENSGNTTAGLMTMAANLLHPLLIPKKIMERVNVSLTLCYQQITFVAAHSEHAVIVTMNVWMAWFAKIVLMPVSWILRRSASPKRNVPAKSEVHVTPTQIANGMHVVN